MPTPHCTGHATARTIPTRLVQGSEKVSEARPGGTTTQVIQTTASDTIDAAARLRNRVLVTRPSPGRPGRPEGERRRAVISQGRPRPAQSRSPTPGEPARRRMYLRKV